MKTILIVDDDVYIGDMLEELLAKENYAVGRAYSGTEALLYLSSRHPDLILLDLMLPGLSGEELLPLIKDIPVIVVSAKAEVSDKVELLLGGAADYITKPFSMNELLARLSAHLRREQRSRVRTKTKFSEELVIDYSDRSLFIKGNRIELSNKEFEIIQLLSMNAGQVFDREKIYEIIWGIDGVGDNVVIKEHIRRIRLKFAEYTEKSYITTVWGVGYKWEK